MIAWLIVGLLFSAVGEEGRSREWEFVDVQRERHRPLKQQDARGFVLVFITTDCPISNYYQPLLGRLHERYQKQGVPFFLCHASKDVLVKEVKKHQQEFRVRVPIVIDQDQRIARRLAAKVTPEAFLIDADGKVVYRGRIDDLYADFGKRRRQARTHDLRDAIDALLAGKPIRTPQTKPVGCFISYSKDPAQPPAESGS